MRASELANALKRLGTREIRIATSEHGFCIFSLDDPISDDDSGLRREIEIQYVDPKQQIYRFDENAPKKVRD